MNIEWNKVTWYSKLGAIILFILVVPVLTFYIGIKYQETKSYFLDPSVSPILNSADPFSSDEESWLTYRNDKYGFELKYPQDWLIGGGDANIYSEGPGVVPGFYIYKDNNTGRRETFVGVYPQGKYSDADPVELETRPSTIKIENKKEAIDSILSDGRTWKTVVTFQNVPSFWEEYGSVQASVKIYNRITNCIKASERNSFEFGCDPQAGLGDKQVIEGDINEADRQTQEKILSTFRFLDTPTL